MSGKYDDTLAVRSEENFSVKLLPFELKEKLVGFAGWLIHNFVTPIGFG